MMTCMELHEFLLARIAEDEALARHATPGPWRWDEPSKESWPQSDESLASWATGEWEPVLSGWGYDASGTEAEPADRAHIARYDPSRVLAECEAKRAVVGSRQSFVQASQTATEFGPKLTGAGAVAGLEIAMKFLALPYADHADYREEWKP